MVKCVHSANASQSVVGSRGESNPTEEAKKEGTQSRQRDRQSVTYVGWLVGMPDDGEKRYQIAAYSTFRSDSVNCGVDKITQRVRSFANVEEYFNWRL